MAWQARNPGVRDRPLDSMVGSLAEMQVLGLSEFSDFGLGGEDYVNRARKRMLRKAEAGDAAAAAAVKRFSMDWTVKRADWDSPAPSPEARQQVHPRTVLKEADRLRKARQRASPSTNFFDDVFAPSFKGEKVNPVAPSTGSASPAWAQPKPAFKTPKFKEGVSWAEPSAPTINTLKGGFGGNVSPPQSVRRVLTDFIVSPTGETTLAREARTKANGSPSTNASTKLRGSTLAETCVERPEGNHAGPGRWRGVWFPWCKE